MRDIRIEGHTVTRLQVVLFVPVAELRRSFENNPQLPAPVSVLSIASRAVSVESEHERLHRVLLSGVAQGGEMLVGDSFKDPARPFLRGDKSDVLLAFIIPEEIFQVNFEGIRYADKGVHGGRNLVALYLRYEALAHTHFSRDLPESNAPAFTYARAEFHRSGVPFSFFIMNKAS